VLPALAVIAAALAEPLPADALPGAVLEVRRVAHRPVQVPALSDGPGYPHAYFSVVAFDSGEVVPLNVWYHPQLFRFHPGSGALVSTAFTFPHERLGNEDDRRWRIRAHKGATAADSLVIWGRKGYEEVDGENGTRGTDAAVFSTRPVQASPGVLPVPRRRVLNLGGDAASPEIGPGRAGIDYDPANRLVFAAMDFPERSERRDALQVLRVSPSGAFEGRLRVPAPGRETRQRFTFVRADPAHRVVLLGAHDPWEAEDLLYLARYEPVAGGLEPARIVSFRQRTAPALAGHDEDRAFRPSATRDALLAERSGRLLAVLGGANGLFVFDLGPSAGPYEIGRPRARVRLRHPVEALRVHGGLLVASSRGLEVLPLDAVLGATGDAAVPARAYRLPYETYEMDVATIGGVPYLFLASGPDGIDVFRLGAVPGGAAGGAAGGASGGIAEPSRAVALPRGPATVLVESGRGLSAIGAPAMNAAGDVAFWAVDAGLREVVILKRAGHVARVVASTGGGRWTALGEPRLGARAQVAFHASRPDGTEAIVIHDGAAAAEVAVQDAAIAYVRPPAMADNGDVAWTERSTGGRARIVLRRASGARVVVAAEDDAWSFGGDGPETPRDGDLDCAPDGSVALVRHRRDTGDAVLSVVRGGDLTDVLTTEPVVSRVRASAGGVACRTWAGDVVRLFRVTPDGQALRVADRRTTYSGWIFGDFRYAASTAAGEVVFSAPRHVVPAMGRECLGYTLHRLDAAHPALPGVVVGPGAVVDGRTVQNVDFAGAIGPAGEAAFTLELESADGRVGFAVVVAAPPGAAGGVTRPRSAP